MDRRSEVEADAPERADRHRFTDVLRVVAKGLTDWVPDEKVRHRVLVENPASLSDFPKG